MSTITPDIPVYDASVSERPLTELRRSSVLLGQPPSDPAVLRSFFLSLFFSPAQDVEREDRGARGRTTWKRARVRGFIDPRQGRSQGGNLVTSGNCYSILNGKRWIIRDKSGIDVLVYLTL
jgi:hypothetical protein